MSKCGPVQAARRSSNRLHRRQRRPSEPHVEVDGPHYDFGTMQRGTTKSHEFTFHNVGHGPLTLRVGNTSCKCTLGSVPSAPIPPGESVNVKLEWTAKINAGPFRQTASVITNDPAQSRVELQVDGKVTEASGVSPADLIFDKVTAGESKSAEVFVMSFTDDPLSVGEPVLSNRRRASILIFAWSLSSGRHCRIPTPSRA